MSCAAKPPPCSRPRSCARRCGAWSRSFTPPSTSISGPTPRRTSPASRGRWPLSTRWTADADKCPRGHRRRRHHRLLCRLPSGPDGLDRCAAPGAAPALVGLHLARGGAGRPAPDQRQHYPAPGLLGRSLRPAGAGDRSRHRLAARRRPAACLQCRPLDRGAPAGDHGQELRAGDAPAVATGGAGALAADDGGGCGRRRVPAHRRPGQPVGHHPGAGKGRALGRCDHPRGGRGHRDRGRARPGAGPWSPTRAASSASGS